MMKRLWILFVAFLLILTSCTQENIPGGPELSIHYLDVGQGDCQLIQSAEHAVLIDAGESSEADRIAAYLEHLGIETLDYVIATHPHSDHIGGLSTLIDRFSVKNVMMPKVSASSESFKKLLLSIQDNGLTIKNPAIGENIILGDVTITILGPVESDHDQVNNDSIVARMVYGRTSFLFTGDAEEIAEKELLRYHSSLRSDVLAIGHHGSQTSTTEEFLKAVRPKAAIISCGQDNAYGHPNVDVLERLQQYDILILRTDEMGDIVLSTDGNDITFTTAKREASE